MLLLLGLLGLGGAAVAVAQEDSSFYAEGGNFPLAYEEQIVDAVLKRSASNQQPVLPPAPESSAEEEAAEEKRSGGGHVDREYIGFLAPQPHDANARLDKHQHQAEVVVKRAEGSPFTDSGYVNHDLFGTILAATTIVCSAAAIFGIVGAGACWYRMQKQRSAAAEAAYPQYGGTGPAIKKKSPTAAGDASLAFSAHLHHFNQTKQKILSGGAETSGAGGAESEASDGEGEEGDFSVYECPGLAPTGDIEVPNPLFTSNNPTKHQGD